MYVKKLKRYVSAVAAAWLFSSGCAFGNSERINLSGGSELNITNDVVNSVGSAVEFAAATASDGAGKKLTIGKPGDNISISGSGASQVAAVDLKGYFNQGASRFLVTGTEGENGKFTIVLAGGGNGYTFSAASRGVASGESNAVCVGIPDTNIEGGTSGNSQYIIFDPKGKSPNMTSSLSTDSNEAARSSVIGAGHVSAAGGNLLNNWIVGNFGANSQLKSTASAKGDNYSSVIGAGYNGGKMIDWTIGNFGNGCILTSSSSSSSSPYSSNSYSSVIGAGYNGGKMNDWTIGNFGEGCTLTSSSSSSSSSRSSVIGAGENYSEMSNWTAEFQGSATVSSVGYAQYDSYIGTIGGYGNSDFRFYFNDKQGSSPVVTVSAFKLSGDWSVTETGTKTATATIAGDQEGNVRAFAIGPNFQINIGRAREITPQKTDDSNNPIPLYNADGTVNATAYTDNSNGTWETDDSVGSGGSANGGNGRLDILGSIGIATRNAHANGSIMQIDSGWEVNCYRPVDGLSKINIINGSLNMIGNDDAGKAKFAVALKQVEDNMSYSRVLKETIIEEGKVVKETTKTELYQNGRGGREGGISIAMAEGEEYPIEGVLTVESGQRLVFGVNSSLNDPKESYFRKAEGYITIPFEVYEGSETIRHLLLNNGWEIAIKDKACVSDDAYEIPDHTNFYVVRGPRLPIGFDRIDSVICSKMAISNEPIDSESDIKLYIIKGGYNIATSDEYTSWDGLNLYWRSDKDGCGLVLGTGDFKAVQVPSNYTQAFASEELAQISAKTTSAVRSAIEYRLCDIKQNGNDPFVAIFGEGAHQDEVLGFGYDAEMYGVVLGLDFVKELKSSSLIKYGALLSYVHDNIDFFGAATGREKCGLQRMYFGGVFGAYEGFDSKGLKGNLNLIAGFGYFENEMWRRDSAGERFDTDFNSTDVYVSAEGVKNIISLNGVQIGPWALVSYNRIHQQGYQESGYKLHAASLTSINFDFIDTVLGVNVEKEFHNTMDAEKRMSVFARAGWNCQPLRSDSSCTARLNHTHLLPFTPVFGYQSKNSAIATLGFRSKLNKNFDINGGIVGQIGHDHRMLHANVSLGYTF